MFKFLLVFCPSCYVLFKQPLLGSVVLLNPEVTSLYIYVLRELKINLEIF